MIGMLAVNSTPASSIAPRRPIRSATIPANSEDSTLPSSTAATTKPSCWLVRCQLAVAVASEITKAPAALLQRYLFTKADFAHPVDMKPDLDAIQKTLDLQHEAGFLAKRVQVGDFVKPDLMAPLK